LDDVTLHRTPGGRWVFQGWGAGCPPSWQRWWGGRSTEGHRAGRSLAAKSLCFRICGSDLHAAKHTREFVDRSRRSGNRWAMDPERDVVFGHEFCCEVVDHGPGTDKRLKSGTLVCSMPMTIAENTVHGIGYSNDIAGGFASPYAALASHAEPEVRIQLPPAQSRERTVDGE
jgi:hypothetical protein